MKDERAEMTVNKLIMIISAVIFLALVIFVVPRQIINLEGQAGGYFDKAILLIDRIGHPDNNSECREGDLEIIGDDIFGKPIICDENCSFDIGGNTLLGTSQFYITDTGYKAKKNGVEYFVDVDSWANDYEKSERDKEAYEVLKDIFENFYFEYRNSLVNSGIIQDKADFYSVIEFDPYAYFTIILDDYMMEVDGFPVYTYYYYDGEDWYREYRGVTETMSRSEVFNEFYERYSDGDDLHWNYAGDDTYRDPISGMNDNYETQEIDSTKFAEWLSSKMVLVDVEDNEIDAFYLDIGSDEYFYKNSQWKKNGLIFNKKTTDEDIFDELVGGNLNSKEIYWYYNYHKRDKRIFEPITDEEIVSRVYREEDLREWYSDMISYFDGNLTANEKLVDYLEDYFLTTRTVNFEGESFDVSYERETDSDGNSRIVFSFETDEDEFSMYIDDLSFVLLVDGKESDVSDSLSLSEEKWEEFLKINLIYEVLRDRCRV